MDRDSLFIINRGDGTTIELLCDDTCIRTKIEYLPSIFIDEGATLESDYANNVPIGMPLASSFKFTLDAKVIETSQALIGKWIYENSSPTNKKPNVWILKRDGNIIYAGIQQPVNKEKYDIAKGKIEIQTISVAKYIFESVRIDSVISTSPTDPSLFIGDDDPLKLYDYKYTAPIVFAAYLRNLRMKFVKLWDFIEACFGEIESKYQYIMRNYSLTVEHWWQNAPKFYEQTTTTINISEPIQPYIISHIFYDNDDALVPFSGAIPELQNRYKQLWNMFDELAKGWSYSIQIKFYGEVPWFYFIPINELYSPENLTDQDIIENSTSIEKSLLNIRDSNTRIVKVRDEDIKIITKNMNITSMTGRTTETSCLFSTEPNTVQYHFGDSPKLTGLTEYDISKNEKPPVFGLYYKIESESYPNMKVSEYFSICGVYYSSGIDYSFLTVDGRDNYNSAIQKLQREGLASFCQDIRDTYLSNSTSQDCLVVSVKNTTVDSTKLGTIYNLDVSSIYDSVPFYSFVGLKPRGVLAKVIEKIYKNSTVNECTFFMYGGQ